MIDCFEFFFVICRPNNNLAIVDFGKIKSMQRLPALQHHVVRGIYDVVDHTNPKCFQPALHPLGAWPNLHTFNQASGVTKTCIGRLDFNTAMIVNRSIAGSRLRVGNIERNVVECGDLTRDTNVTETIRPVTGDLKINRLVTAHRLCTLVVQTGHRQTIHKVVVRHAQLDVLF